MKKFLKTEYLAFMTPIIAALIFGYFFGHPPVKGNLYYVKRVVDGDTIELATGATVRLIGINTPETVKPNSPVECFGPESSEFSKKLMQRKYVRLESDKDNMDQYGRILRYVYLDDQMVNMELVREGFAKAYYFSPNNKYKTEFDLAQTEAQSTDKGLWGKCTK